MSVRTYMKKTSCTVHVPSIMVKDRHMTRSFSASKVLPRTPNDFLRTLIVFVAYFGTALAGSYLFTAPAVVFPASGIALGLLFIWGIRIWPGVFLGAIAMHMFRGYPTLALLILPLAQTIQAVLGAYVLQKLKVSVSLNRLRDMLAILFVSFFVSLIVPSSWFAANALLNTPAQSSVTWGTWWTGMITSILILSPLLIRWVGKPRLSPRRTIDWIETGAAFAVLIAVSILLSWTPYTMIGQISLIYILLVPLFYIALRIGPRFTVLATFLTTAIGMTGVFMGVNAPSSVSLGQRLFQTEVLYNILAGIFFIMVAVEEERKELTKSLNAYIKRLERALNDLSMQDRAKSEFLAAIAHELRNPLAPVASSIDLLALKGLVAREGRATLDMMSERIATVRRLLDNLLDLSRLTEKKAELAKEIVDVETVLERSLRSVEEHAKNKAQRIDVERPNKRLLIDADPVRIEQVLTNLLMNASKFSPRGSIVEASVRRAGNEIEIRVSDKGVGIESDMLTRIFEPFEQIGTSYRSEGLGIGLSLAQKFVELHGGSIRAESPGRGKGATFVVRLPLHEEAKERREEEPEQTEIRNPAHAMDSRRVLVVDDNIAAASSMAALLKATGHQVDTAYSGEEAQEKTKSFSPHIVLLDLGLPDVDGYTVARLLRTDLSFKGTIIALTGYGQADDKARSAEAGCDYHLVKPIGFSDLREIFTKIA